MAELLNDGYPFTLTQARDLGVNEALLKRHLVEGVVRRPFRGVYVDARVPDSRQGRLRALALVNPGGAIACNETAAWLHGISVFAPGDRHLFDPSFVVEHSHARVERSGTRGRQAIIASDDIEFIDGVYVTTPLRTVSDLLRRMYRPYALAAADAFAHAGLIDPDEVVEYVARLKGYRGVVQARSLALLIEPRTQSPGESWQRLRMLDAGFPPPEPQFEIVDDFGRSFFVDLPYPELLIGTEFDGREFHTAGAHRAHDEERRDYLSELYGWRWVIGTRERIFGPDTSFEDELGDLLGIVPLKRWWGFGR
ncbi:type IV toxin-antitoxin system AbiEi family antitoxin domain-containing protein [Aeromicrobium sp.]|uniref:type IV toxin-antitoxin system AbiEi family antitoxin domain-containing protein n=1 Tax=Aeromicrobium sp. TaxID=1871063 RepID=UPI002FC72929